MHKLTTMELKKLINLTGHALVVEDFDDIAELDSLAKLVSDPFDRINQTILHQPIRVRNYSFSKANLATISFIEAVLQGMYNEPNAITAAVMWSLTCDSRELWGMTESEIRKAVNRFCISCRLFPEEVEAIFDYCLGSQDSDAENGEHVSCAPIVAMLVREYGQTAGYWLHDASVGEIAAMSADYERRIDAENEAARKSSGGKGPFRPSAKAHAFIKYKRKLNELSNKWQTTR